MNRHLARFLEGKKEAVECLRRGERRRAGSRLLEAVEGLCGLAAAAGGELGEHWQREAKGLLDAARRLRSGGTGAVRGRRPDGTEDGSDGRRFLIRERPRLCLDDVAGLDDAKEEIRLRLLHPFRHPEAARRYRLQRGGGLLLFGPPGTGKTLLARAIAGEVEAEFFAVKPSDILSKWVGDAEANVASLFRAARSAPLAVIFIDELDALAPRRGEPGSAVMARLVPQLLAEMEGFDRESRNALLILGATNEPWLLDRAILRPGRFDEKIYVGLPDGAARRKLLEIHLAARPLAKDLDLEAIASGLEGFSGADIRRLCERAAAAAFLASLESGRERRIGAEDLLRLAAEAPPSVTPAMLSRYASFARGGAPRPAEGET
jgi:SpoVK/Ycf46/Vps4 family AAA+-type ATPase